MSVLIFFFLNSFWTFCFYFCSLVKNSNINIRGEKYTKEIVLKERRYIPLPKANMLWKLKIFRKGMQVSNLIFIIKKSYGLMNVISLKMRYNKELS